MILIIDDDSAVRSSLSFMLKRAGYEAQTVPGPREAMEVVRSVAPDLILMDMNFTLSTTGEEGLTLLKQVKIFRPETPVILMTAWGSIQLAVQGMQAGAFDFITKPWNNAALLQRIETALQLSGTPQEPTQEQSDSFDRSHIIGRSQGLMDVLNTIARIAKTNASVLITGESGTGKELIAEAIHINSQRAKHPFVKVNLGGISQSLFESEMFGHKKGAFTDASADRIGRFEMANKGTIFLDEIGVFLPLITTNCCILGVAILVIQKDYDLLTGVVYAFSTAIGFGLALVLFAGLREQMSLVKVPKGMQGTPIALITAGLLAMAFMGFSGVV